MAPILEGGRTAAGACLSGKGANRKSGGRRWGAAPPGSGPHRSGRHASGAVAIPQVARGGVDSSYPRYHAMESASIQGPGAPRPISPTRLGTSGDLQLGQPLLLAAPPGPARRRLAAIAPLYRLRPGCAGHTQGPEVPTFRALL